MIELPPTDSQIRMNKIKAFATIKNSLDFFKVIGVYLFLCILAILPVLAGFTGMFVEETITGGRAHEGKSIFGAIPWLAMITIPAGFVLLIVWTIIIIKSNIVFYSKQN